MGFSVAITPENLLFVLIGATVGTLFGAFPGLGAPTAIALLLPLTFTLDPTTAIIMLAGIYYGAMYGNSISAVLIGIPGNSAAVITALEGHKLALKGRAGHALTVSAVSSFAAGILGMIIFAVMGPQLAWLALRFGPPEYFCLMILAFAMLPAFATEGRAKLLVSLGLGLAFAVVGVDQFTTHPRFTFGLPELFSGIPFVPAIIGLFGIGDVFYLAGFTHKYDKQLRGVTISELFPVFAEWVRLKWTILRNSLLGFAVGVLPGAGATIASFAAYAMERSFSKRPQEFGSGVMEGVASGEAANSGASIGAMVPLLTLGIPGSGATAVMMGGFLIWGLQPGPMLFQNDPKFVWGLIASLLIGNIMLLLMNIFLVPVFAQILRIRQTVLTSIILVFCAAGVYSVNTSVSDIWIMLAFGFLGYIFNLMTIPTAPLVLGLVLGRMLEANMRQSFALSDSGLFIFLQRPISATILIIAAAAFFLPPLYDVFKAFIRRYSKT